MATLTAQELTALSTKAIDAKATAYCMTLSISLGVAQTPDIQLQVQRNEQLTCCQAHTPNSVLGHASSRHPASSSPALMSKMPPIQLEPALSAWPLALLLYVLSSLSWSTLIGSLSLSLLYYTRPGLDLC